MGFLVAMFWHIEDTGAYIVVVVLGAYSVLFSMLGRVLTSTGNPITAGVLHTIAILITPLLGGNVVRVLGMHTSCLNFDAKVSCLLSTVTFTRILLTV